MPSKPTSLGVPPFMETPICFLQPWHNEEATDIMNDTSKSGRWVSFHLTSTSDYVVAEADKKLGDHIKNLSVFNKAIIICLPQFPTNKSPFNVAGFLMVFVLSGLHYPNTTNII